MERRIVRAERALDLAARAAGFILLRAWPERQLALTRPMMVVGAGVAHLGAGPRWPASALSRATWCSCSGTRRVTAT